MKSFSRRIKREVVAVALVAGASLTYFMLADSPWAVYATVCVAYTIVVVGMVWADGKWKFYFGRETRNISRFTQIHIGFMLAAVLLLWFAIQIGPAMPEWLVSRGGDKWSWYHVLIIALMVGLVIWEQHWIEKSGKRAGD